MEEDNKTILTITANKPWIAFPHTMAMKIDTSWIPFEFLVNVSIILAQQISNGNARVIVSFHPRLGKTTLCVLYLIIWFLNLYPDRTVIFSTYSEEFSTERARLVRNAIKENERYLNVRLAPDSQSTDRFHTLEGGGLISLGIGSGLAGLPCDLLVVDDIFKNFSVAQNPNEQKKVTDWFCDAYMRLQPRGSIVVVGARTNVRDLQGYLMTEHSDDWQLISFPAISEGAKTDPLKRSKGTALCPQLFNSQALEKIKNSVGPEKWASQYCQEPLRDKLNDGAQIVFSNDDIGKIKNSPLPPFENIDFEYTRKKINYIGLDIGGRRSHTAIIIGQLVEESDPDMSELHLIYIKKFQLNFRLRAVIEELDNLSLDPRFGELCPLIVFDASGAGGDQAGQLIRERGIKPAIPVSIIGTGKGNPSKRTVPKTLLVENLQDFFSERRIRIPQNLSGADLLFNELRGYRSRSSPKGRTISYRPTGRNGSDDLVDSLALICWAVSKQWKILYAREAEGLYENSRSIRRPLSNNRESLYSNRRSISDSFYPKFHLSRFL